MIGLFFSAGKGVGRFTLKEGQRQFSQNKPIIGYHSTSLRCAVRMQNKNFGLQEGQSLYLTPTPNFRYGNVCVVIVGSADIEKIYTYGKTSDNPEFHIIAPKNIEIKIHGYSHKFDPKDPDGTRPME